MLELGVGAMEVEVINTVTEQLQMEKPELDLHQVFIADVEEMIAARQKCQIIHRTSDIDAAGDEVEVCVRSMLKGRIGDNFYVGHGHIIDQTLRSSSQFDVVIADRAVVPPLFRTRTGTEYFPYESVYAVGEIKATYYKSKAPIAKYVEQIRRLKELNREDVPAQWVRTYTGGIDFAGYLKNMSTGPRNIMYSFMVFVSSNDFAFEDIFPLYESTPLDLLPNCVCLLDRGLILYIEVTPSKRITIVNHPSSMSKKPDSVYRWSLRHADVEVLPAYNWGGLCASIVEHLMAVTVKPVSPIAYIQAQGDATYDVLERAPCTEQHDTR